MVRFSMDEIRAGTPVDDGDAKASRPWLRAILSGAIFGGLTAAAANWFALHSQAHSNRERITFGRNWATGLAGVCAGAIATYSTLRPADEAPVTIDNDGPRNEIRAETVQSGDKIKALSAGERSL